MSEIVDWRRWIGSRDIEDMRWLIERGGGERGS